MSREPDNVTLLLHEWQSGNQEALDQLMPIVYSHLRIMASHYLSRERPDHTMRATELVHEAYLKLLGANVSLNDRAHFYALAARVIRHILVNHGKAKRSEKRGGGAAAHVPLDEAVLSGGDRYDTIAGIHEALERLEAYDPRKASVVELIFFGGLDQNLAATALSISPATLRRELRLAKAWLYNELHPAGGQAE